MLFLGKAWPALQTARSFFQRGQGILPSGLLGQGSIGLAISHSPETVVQRALEQTTVRVVPTDDAGGPTQTLSIGEERGARIDRLPLLFASQFEHGFSIQAATDVIYR